MRRQNTEAAPIIIKRGKKHKHEFHGGNWKVAMADFMTTMFIFFLLLWLLNIVAKEQNVGIADYFAPVSVSRNTSGSGGVLGGQSIIVDGTYPQSGGPPSMITGNSNAEGDGGDTEVDDFPPEDAEPMGNLTVPNRYVDQVRRCIESSFRDCEVRSGQGGGQGQQAVAGKPARQVEIPSENDLNYIVSNTAEGFKITLQEIEGQPMFETGSALPLPRLESALQQIAPLLLNFPSRIKLVGHTDAVPYASAVTGGRSNWELSSERANAARRVLVQSGLPLERLGEVTGKASSETFEALEPREAGNRRIDIILLADTPPVSIPSDNRSSAPAGEDRLFAPISDQQPSVLDQGGQGTSPDLPPESLQEPLSLIQR